MKKIIKILPIAILLYIIFSLVFVLELQAGIISSLHAQLSSVDNNPLSRLVSLSESKLIDLKTTNFWSHTNSNGCDFKCRSVGILKTWIGENIYKFTNPANEKDCSIEYALKAWKNSPEHLQVLNHDYDFYLLGSSKNTNTCYLILEKIQL